MIELNALRRPAGDILSRSIRFSLGGQDYILPVRSIRANREWLAAVDATTSGLLSSLDESGDDLSAVYAALASQTDQMIDLLISYAPDALPSREAIEEIEPDASLDVLAAVTEVWRAANPLVAMSLEAISTLTPIPESPSSPPTSTPPPSTAGRRKSSKAV